MRGYFGIGVENISKEQNAGTLARTAHAFGASFFFTIAPAIDIHALRMSDTSGAFDHVPYYQYGDAAEMSFPAGCQLVGIELTDDAVELPSFRHPVRAAYILGPEMGHLSQAAQDQCDFIIKIPMKFCVNVGVAGAIVLYDRMLSMGRFAERPVRAGAPPEPLRQPGKGGLRRFTRKKA